MKNTILVLFVIVSGLVSGQNYKLFNAGSKKLFSEYPVNKAGYSMAFDTAFQNGTDSVYYNYFRLNDTMFISDTCMFWGGPSCWQQNFPSWIGRGIIHSTNDQYRFFNIQGDTLTFNFNVNPLDTLLFYKDNIQKFRLVFTHADTIFINSVQDLGRHYRIIHTDLNGVVQNSPLNQKEIIISENYGLIRFFQIDSFPLVLKPLMLIGEAALHTDMYAMTNAILYDYYPGDEIQYHEYYHVTGGPPWLNYDRYRKNKVLSRNLTADSIIYNISYEFFDTDSVVLHTGITMLNYNRFDAVAGIPYEKFDGSSRILNVVDYCGIPKWTYQVHSTNNLAFCERDTCWGFLDTGGPPLTGDITYVAGLGIYRDDTYVLYPNGFSSGFKINYFKKNGFPCGNEVVLGIDEISGNINSLVVSPNPAHGLFNLTASIPIQRVIIRDLKGQNLICKELTGIEGSIDVSFLPAGIYFAEVHLINMNVEMKKLIVW